jgi:hypothetical protein
VAAVEAETKIVRRGLTIWVTAGKKGQELPTQMLSLFLVWPRGFPSFHRGRVGALCRFYYVKISKLQKHVKYSTIFVKSPCIDCNNLHTQIFVALKGTVSRDFRPSVFFIKQYPQAPDSRAKAFLNSASNSPRYDRFSTAKIVHTGSMTPHARKFFVR